MERHRLLWLYLQQCTDFFSAPLRVLEIAPQKHMQDLFRGMKNIRYESVDLSSPIAQSKMDLIDLQLPDNSYDWVFCYHVLDHIPDDRKAMREMFRVMKPDAWAIIQCPIDHSRAETYEDFSVTSSDERAKHFGQPDHVRIYGKDYAGRLREAEFTVELNHFVQTLDPRIVRRYALHTSEILYICRKPSVAIHENH
jgi:ubiquinone/menaquinone biosynthesis C-methylase UbiE